MIILLFHSLPFTLNVAPAVHFFTLASIVFISLSPKSDIFVSHSFSLYLVDEILR